MAFLFFKFYGYKWMPDEHLFSSLRILYTGEALFLMVVIVCGFTKATIMNDLWLITMKFSQCLPKGVLF